MSLVKSVAAGVALAASVLAPQANAASTFVPAAPLPFELVNLRATVDSCAFNPDTVHVVNTGTVIQVRMRDNNCLIPGALKQVDIRLGAFPIGHYSVEVAQENGEPERLQFSVVPRVTIAVVPPPPFPLTDYTGVWWDPSSPGWGLTIHQSPLDTVFAALFEYGDGTRAAPTWYTLQSGQWISSTTWMGRIYRTTNPPLEVQDLGLARLEFDVPAPDGVPTHVRWGRVTFTRPGGTIVNAFITRQVP